MTCALAGRMLAGRRVRGNAMLRMGAIVLGMLALATAAQAQSVTVKVESGDGRQRFNRC